MLKPEQVAHDIASLHRIVDYVMAQDLYATIRIERSRADNEYMVQVEVDDEEVAKRVTVSPELEETGIRTRCDTRERRAAFEELTRLTQEEMIGYVPNPEAAQQAIRQVRAELAVERANAARALIDPEAIKAEMLRWHPEPEGFVPPVDYPDASDRRATESYINARLRPSSR